jgi:polar amino acid transport system ATP-binding protein
MEIKYEPELDKENKNKPVLRLINIWKSYEDLEVLKGISFDVMEKEVKVIFGPSGSGKSTLLRCINMLNPPDKGTIFLRGRNLNAPETNLNTIRSRIGMVFQHFNLFTHLKAIDNVSLGLRRVKGLSRIEAREKAQNGLIIILHSYLVDNSSE